MKKEKSENVLEMRREVLLDCLTALRPGLASTVVEQTSSYLFIDNAICSFNDEVFVLVDNFKTGFRGTVKADVLYKLIQKLNDEYVTISFKKNAMRVTAGDTSFGLATGSLGEVENMLEDFQFDKMKWKAVDSHFSRGVEMCSFYASKDMEEPHLTGVLIDGKNILSSDRYRVSWYIIDEPVSKEPFIIPATCGAQIGKYNFSEISVHDNWAHLRRQNFYMCSRLVGGTSSSITEDMLRPFPEKVKNGFTFPEEFVNALDRALIILEGEDLLKKSMSMKVSSDTISCSVETEHAGWIKQKIAITDGPEKATSVKVNPVFLREVLRHTKDVHILKGDTQLLYFPSDRFKHCISLV